MSPAELGWIAAVLCAALAAGAHLRMRARLELVARADHELRGPLTAARLALHGLDRAERVPARVAALDLELCRATLAVEDLAAARAGRRAIGRLEVVDINALLTEAAPAWSELAGLFGAELVLERGATALVCTDRLRLAQAIANLIANAAEHAGGQVRVRVSAARGRVRVEVADDGPGLPHPVAELARGARGGRGGRGRGLAIASTAAQQAGGGLTTAPSASGARLVLDLPAVGAAASGDL